MHKKEKAKFIAKGAVETIVGGVCKFGSISTNVQQIIEILNRINRVILGYFFYRFSDKRKNSARINIITIK